MKTAATILTLMAAMLLLPSAIAAPALDETPAAPEEWGYRPAEGLTLEVTPPNFSWRPMKEIAEWEVEVGTAGDFEKKAYSARGIELNVHTPPVVLAPGAYAWRYRGYDKSGEATGWSQARAFSISDEARQMPLPTREEAMSRIPKEHPRLFVRPEDMAHLRELAKGDLKPQYDAMIKRCDVLLKDPPSTVEPPKYPEGTVTLCEVWRVIWWGNREVAVSLLGGAAELAFARLLSGNDAYGRLAKRILLETAKWDPKGATGYRYNDEACMPYNYHFTRTYTFLNDMLSEEEKEVCRKVMLERGREMYNHLHPNHLWRPFNSHSNRAWHKLGEIGIAFHDELEEADDWSWFALNVFFNAYPVWSDQDGGWHEGNSYWSSYQSRFTWWADVMRAAFGINAYDKPFYSQAGYYPLYLMPPGGVGGGFGDLTPERTPKNNAGIMTDFARQAGNPYWQWYVEAVGGPQESAGFVGYIRAALPHVEAKPPVDLPTSRLFRGTGQAMLNSTLLDAKKNVQVLFKASPFGTQSHGYDANNAFILSAFGRAVLLSSGRRDIYGSDHHKKWMWSTRSGNAITAEGGHGQLSHSAQAKGEVIAFETTPAMDLVAGEAGSAYRIPMSDGTETKTLALDRATRVIVFAKPGLVLIYDRLEAPAPMTFEYWLHSPEKFALENGQAKIGASADESRVAIEFLQPAGLKLDQTNEYDPNPRERMKIREWHLTAVTPEKSASREFVALYRPHKAGETPVAGGTLEKIDGGYALRAPLENNGELIALLPASDDTPLEAHGLKGEPGELVARRIGSDGTVKQELRASLKLESGK